jgi:hypothetical protein
LSSYTLQPGSFLWLLWPLLLLTASSCDCSVQGLLRPEAAPSRGCSFYVKAAQPGLLLLEAATPLSHSSSGHSFLCRHSWWLFLLVAAPPFTASYRDCYNSIGLFLAVFPFYAASILLRVLLLLTAPSFAATYLEAAPPLAALTRGCSSFGCYLQRLLLLWPLLTEAAPPLAASYRGCTSFDRYLQRLLLLWQLFSGLFLMQPLLAATPSGSCPNRGYCYTLASSYCGLFLLNRKSPESVIPFFQNILFIAIYRLYSIQYCMYNEDVDR